MSKNADMAYFKTIKCQLMSVPIIYAQKLYIINRIKREVIIFSYFYVNNKKISFDY